MAMPCNNFGRQESGTNAEIAEFAKKKKATFSVFEKMECDDGKRTAPIYQDLISSPVNGGEGLGWNFAKFEADTGPAKPTLFSFCDFALATPLATLQQLAHKRLR